jgi:bifunctional enzyme CysN/CysC
MAHKSDLIAEDIHAYLKSQENKGLLQFITCGSVDDGKSTLIGRMLYESKMLFEDQLASLEADSKKSGTQGDEIDLALLVDGLAAEREQGITIDVAYRFFSTDRRKFIVADTPGHEQYTRNMATGASTADVAIVLIDARKGVLTQTRRHSFIVSMIGVKKVLLAVNKMDLVDYSEEVYENIKADYAQFAKDALALEEIAAIPVSALKGDNVVELSEKTPWYKGATLMEYLETVKVKDRLDQLPFRMPVQWVNRPDHTFRGFSGQIAGGTLRPGDRIKTLPSGHESTVSRIVTKDGDLDCAVTGMSVTITLNDEIDVSRGDVLAAGESPCGVADQFQARILWMSDKPMLPGRHYLMKMGARTVTVAPAKPKHKIDVNTLDLLPAKTLSLNEIGVCNISVDQNIAFDAYDENRAMGGFVMIDRMTNNTVGMGLIDFALRRASNIHREPTTVDKEARALQKGQRPVALWFTGLSGSGKSTIANLVEKKLHARGNHTVTLDGDNMRHGLNRDLGFTNADRVENIRRVGEVARLMVNAGLITLTAFISPFHAERKMARDLLEDGEFIEIFVDTPLDIAEGRDAKGLYKKARAGEIKNFTGIDSPYERPEQAEIHLKMDGSRTAEEAADEIVAWLEAGDYLA